MHARRSIDIRAPATVVYGYAQDVARWPEILPHYRFVEVLREAPGERLVRMAARRDWIPVSWIALQRLDPATPRIEFTHTRGWTSGMEVAWEFEPINGGTRVSIVHDLNFTKVPVVGDWIGRKIIGDFFVCAIAGKTLERMKQLAEGKSG